MLHEEDEEAIGSFLEKFKYFRRANVPGVVGLLGFSLPCLSLVMFSREVLVGV